MADDPQDERGRRLGVVGLGRIGGGLALQATEKGIDVVGKHTRPRPDMAAAGVDVVTEARALAERLPQPRLIYLSVPAGAAIDAVLEELAPHLGAGDVVMDGGNSWYRDSMRRAEDLRRAGVIYMDVGTSGGVPGARRGACFMVGGDAEGFALAAPVLRALAVCDAAVIHTGPSGSGHFVKLVHNGIEFGMLQAIGEGYALLKDSAFDLDPAEIFGNWSNGSVIRGWLVELMHQQLRDQGAQTDAVPDYVEDTGEVNWLVQEAIGREVPIPVITQAVIELFRSRTDDASAYRAVALMRHGFGDHPFGRDEDIAEKRGTSRLEGI
ncbi:decarboxylating 6-phosphogluconate dehydrogenase [Rhodobacteraceae bacterium 2CG4]|uniref:Decarboxylating 6-phosphogluconate dehydrogenase n=1 Tax=Halovulum marinum TaxID=2662447 RepID=A0A6L5Z129_9RHOB|nr:decarboxylating 6-phosphogluconate dehydrogenase [Halovulum marinum]MSU90276.1 decarboxylating 6-phosphogluconate dehydrogenase [Halovulum marinum]